MPAAFPPLAPYPTQCGWLYPAMPAGPGHPVFPAVVSLIRFTPLGLTEPGERAECDMCGAHSETTHLWWWSDQWAGGVSIGGLECAECLTSGDSVALSDGGWVPSPLALTAG